MIKFFLLISLFVSCSFFVRYKRVDLIPGHIRSQHEFKGKKVAIASQGRATSRAALEMFERGGNIIDAFAAASFAISVERPQSSGIGGGGFLLLNLKEFKEPKAYDFREFAPFNAKEDMFLIDGNVSERISQEGPLSVAVPGLVYGVLKIHQQYGKLSREQVMRPAIDLARNGLTVYPHLAQAILDKKEVLKKYGDGAKIFFKNGIPLKTGDRLYQEDLAKTLELIAEKGSEGFYKGRVAKSIVESVQNLGGLLTLEDFHKVKLVERVPLKGKYKDYDIYTMPPPSSGGTHVLQILNVLENAKLANFGIQSWQALHYQASAMLMAFADRAEYMGDSDFVDVPVEKIISKNYGRLLFEKISIDEKLSSKEFPNKVLLKESDDTIHFTIMDSEGNMVSSTQTINGWFGSGIVPKGTGIVLNNEMDDFAAKVGASNLFGAIGGKNNLIKPLKRPLSSMSPTLVFKNNKAMMALGTPSGTRILTCVAQVLHNIFEFELPLYEAVAATRIHHQWQPDQLFIEDPGIGDNTIKKLKNLGYDISNKNLGCKIQATQKRESEIVAVSDQRGEGLAIGK